MSQFPEKAPKFDLTELDGVRRPVASDVPPAAPEMPAPAAAPAEGSDGGFDSSAELLKAIHDLNSTSQQILQALTRLLDS